MIVKLQTSRRFASSSNRHCRRFDVRPSPAASSQTSPGSVPVQRPGPPATVFNLGPSSAATQRLLSSPPSASQNRQQQNFPTFPQPQFGGFRPIKRHLEVPEVKHILYIIIYLSCIFITFRMRMRYFLKIFKPATTDRGGIETRKTRRITINHQNLPILGNIKN